MVGRSSLFDQGTHIVVVDLETTCWEYGDAQRKECEIIEIGVVLSPMQPLICQDEWEALKWSNYVRPTFSPILSPFCKRLTGIEQEAINGAPPWRTIYLQFNAFLVENLPYGSTLVFGAWGDFDKKVINKECRRANIPYPAIIHGHINLKKQLHRAAGFDTHRPLATFLNDIGLTFEGTPHEALDDAYNTWRAFSKLSSEGRL